MCVGGGGGGGGGLSLANSAYGSSLGHWKYSNNFKYVDHTFLPAILGHRQLKWKTLIL